jgi:hypothetical protein
LHGGISPALRQAGGQGIALAEFQRQPGLEAGPPPRQRQWRLGGIEAEHQPTGPHPLRQHKGQIAGAAAEIKKPLSLARLQPGAGLALPEPMQAEAQQIVEAVVAGGDALEQGAHRIGIRLGGRWRHPRAGRSHRD